MARTFSFRHKSKSSGSGWGWRGKNSQLYQYSKHSHRTINRSRMDEIYFIKYDCKFKSCFNGWFAHRTQPESTHLANIRNISLYYEDYRYNKNKQKETLIDFIKRKIIEKQEDKIHDVKYYQDTLKQIERRGKVGKFISHKNERKKNVDDYFDYGQEHFMKRDSNQEKYEEEQQDNELQQQRTK